MATSYEAIRREFAQVQDYIIGDLDRLTALEHGGNYIAAALITCACDALSYLKHGKQNEGYRFFEEMLPSEWRPVAKSLYEAIRHGIVHSYDTQLICIGSRELDVTISWGQKPHLHLSADEKHIYVNIKNLSMDFKTAVAQFKSDLEQQDKLRDIFAKSIHRSRRLHLRNNETAKWEQCLKLAKHDAT